MVRTYILSVVLLLSFVFPPFLKSASSEIISLSNSHEEYRNDEKGLVINVTFTVDGMKNYRGKVVAYFYKENGDILRDRDKNYYTIEGQVCCSKTFTPSYDGSRYTDFELFIPYEQLDIEGLNVGGVLRYSVYIFDNNNVALTHKENEFGFLQMAVKCVDCWAKGTKRCMSCSGTGSRYTLNPYTMRNQYITCERCGGRGTWTCSTCNGKTYKTETRSFENSTTNSANGIVNGATDNYPSYQKTTHSCRVCNGTGWVKIPIAGAVTSEYCSHCDRMMSPTDRHFHQQCGVCYGKGYYEN